MVLDPIPQPLPVHFFGSRPQPPTSPYYGSSATSLIWDWRCSVCDVSCSCVYCGFELFKLLFSTLRSRSWCQLTTHIGQDGRDTRTDGAATQWGISRNSRQRSLTKLYSCSPSACSSCRFMYIYVYTHKHAPCSKICRHVICRKVWFAGVLQCVAVCCSVGVAVCCSVLQCVAV